MQELVFELELARSAGETLFPTDLTVHDIEELFVMGKSGSSVLFIDLGVYTKNRNFRLLGSAKLGKLVHLTDTSNTEMDFDRFRKSLVCDDEMNCTILKIAEASLPISHGHQSIRHMPCHIFNDATEVVRYPQIESELISHMNKLSEGTPSIKSRVYRENMIILAVTNHRYCFNAGRSHQSNGIFYIVDLVKRIFYQKCHDPDCRGFRSNDFPLGDTTLHDCPPRQLL